MTERAKSKELLAVTIEDELKQSYLEYAMSVIVGRALPDVRDGLKPVHRRVLHAMNELKNDWNKAYKKSARVVGDVIGKYHPHGESAVYEAIVRLAQPFSTRYLLVDGQGNFGSVDGDPPAAMRYTEVRMSKIAHYLLSDIDKETVDFVPNYDETETYPSVMPTRIPNLLINGSSGIAVGMATNIPPHNLGEIIDACLALLDEPDLSIDQLMEYVPGPDFPTAGIINGRAGIVEAYRTGRGRVHMRARTETEFNEQSGKQAIIITELPYQVNKARLIEKIAELVKDKKVEGITGLRDESDKDGMRVVIDLRRGESSEVVLNNLYAHTQLDSVFGINMVALIDGRPAILNLKNLLEAFLQHRKTVVMRRSIFELRKARERAHILEGLALALANIDKVITLIKQASNPQEAKTALLGRAWELGLVSQLLSAQGALLTRPLNLPPEYGNRENGYWLSPEQAQAILDLRLHRLTGLEQDKIVNEYRELIAAIHGLNEIIQNPQTLINVIREELRQVKQEFADPRRTEIVSAQQDLQMEDLIPPEDVAVTLSHLGYIKYQTLDNYQAQKRGGKGKTATQVRDEDFVEQILIANTHDTLLCFSSRGRAYWLKVYQLPQATRLAKGRPIVNLLPLEENERISAILPLTKTLLGDLENKYVFMATASGLVKKTPLSEFSRPRSSGIIGIDLLPEDCLVGVDITDGSKDIMLFTDAGKALRFGEAEVRACGRAARGVRGIKLEENQKVIALMIVQETGAILVATENGYGKRTAIDEYQKHGRGGKGIIAIQISERNGKAVAAELVHDGEEIMLISDHGVLVRTRVDEISIIGRNTQGVTLINLIEGEKLAGVAPIKD